MPRLRPAMPESTPVTQPTVDPHAGLGGSYVINPETGERELAERTAEAPRGPEADAETVPPQPE